MPIYSSVLNSRAVTVIGLRLSSATLGSVVFGLMGAGFIDPWSMANAALLSVLFGTAFAGMTGYRLIRFAWRGGVDKNPVTWSDVVTCTALAAAVGCIPLPVSGLAAEDLLCAYGLAVNAAYLPAKIACLVAGCCRSTRHVVVLGREVDLRRIELSLTAIVLAAAIITVPLNTQGAALIGLGGHLLVRLFSHWWRHLLPRTWHPLHHPTAEFSSLVLLIVLTVLTWLLW